MTDLHTHILPGMDDGAGTIEESLHLLQAEYSQGVDTVVLTPHFYRDLENPKRFLQRRREAVDMLNSRLSELPDEEQNHLPNMILGAEVAWWPTTAEWDELPELCIGDTKNLLLELPFSVWNDRLIDQLHEFYGRTGITPVIAHPERYLKLQKQEHVDAILSLGFPVQISADALLRPLSRGRALKLLRQGQGTILASDCHNCTSRIPNLAAAMQVVSRKLGAAHTERIIGDTDRLIAP